MPRQFLAVVPGGLADNAQLKALLAKLKRTLGERGVTVRWNPPSLWHVTLVFLGERPNAGDVSRALAEWRPDVREIEFKLQGLGVFPEVDAARVLWVGVAASRAFLDLQTSLVHHLAARGIEAPAELTRPYRPHLTLARFRNPLGARDLVGLGGRTSFGAYRPTEVVLFESVLENQMVKYLVKERHALG